MDNQTLTYMFIGFVSVFLIALFIYIFPFIKKLFPKRKKSKKVKKEKQEVVFKRPVLLAPSRTTETKQLGFEPKKEEKPELVMEFPPLVTKPQPTKIGNNTVINTSRPRNIGAEFNEIKNYLKETSEEDIFTSVSRESLNRRPITPPPAKSSIFSSSTNDYRAEFPEFVPTNSAPSFNYSRPKDYMSSRGSVLDLQKDEKDILRQFRNLSPEMKKLLITDILSTKKSDNI